MDLRKRLENLAYKKTIPFCYGCYIECPTGRCVHCFSDDLMRLLPGHSLEWGVSHAVEAILNENLCTINVDEAFEDSIRSCYPETVTVGWLELDTVTTIRQMDPISWELAKSEFVDSEEQEGLLMSLDHGSTYFSVSDIEEYLDSVELEATGT